MPNKNSKKIDEHSKRYPFIAEHRGGPLTKENHQKLINWARICSEHVIALIDKRIDKRLKYALDVAKKWENGNVSTGVAIKASLGAHEVAKKSEDPVNRAVARAIGQAVATSHMADHSLVAAFYALKAVKFANMNVDKERDWQTKKLNELPSDLIEIVHTMWKKKDLERKI